MYPRDITGIDIVNLAKKGDPEAWDNLYRRHRSTVHSWCWEMTRNSADADDLTQEVFLRLFLGLATFRGTAQLRTWLHRITVKCVLMHWRKYPKPPDSPECCMSYELPSG